MALGGSRPTHATVGTSSLVVLRAFHPRKRAELVNDSSNIIYLAKGMRAVVGDGIRLNALGGNYTIEPDSQGEIWTGSVHAIATGANSNLSLTEDW